MFPKEKAITEICGTCHDLSGVIERLEFINELAFCSSKTKVIRLCPKYASYVTLTPKTYVSMGAAHSR